MSSETSNLVSQSLGSNDGNFITDFLVGLEIQSQTWVIFFNNNSGSSLDSLGSYSTLNDKNIAYNHAELNGCDWLQSLNYKFPCVGSIH